MPFSPFDLPDPPPGDCLEILPTITECSSLCAKDEPCSITANGKCDAKIEARAEYYCEKLWEARAIIRAQREELEVWRAE